MSILKCKMCGADLNPKEGEKICECEFCGTKQTISSSNDEKILKSIARGNSLRNKCEFDRAFSLFNQLVVEGYEDAEIYWNLVLCKYGITYVDDYDGNKKPTINRMSNISILEDEDYKKTIELADVISREQYKYEANTINNIQNEILDIVSKEEPYDVFISYKETDEFGERTNDSVIAYDIYDTLTKEGYKVFLSRVSLSKIVGQSYEPYIYSALFSSKVMVLVTTSDEYVNAVWVKNEWSRFLGMMKDNKEKLLIPCYKDMDPYDLPKELRNIQSIDLSKIGAIQDLKIGLSKILKKNNNSNTTNFNDAKDFEIKSKIERCNILLDEGNYEKVYQLIEDVLNLDPKNAEAYSLLLLADFKTTLDKLQKNPLYVKDNVNYEYILKFGDEKIINIFKNINNKFVSTQYNNFVELYNRKKDSEIFSDVKEVVLSLYEQLSIEDNPTNVETLKQISNTILNKLVLIADKDIVEDALISVSKLEDYLEIIKILDSENEIVNRLDIKINNLKNVLKDEELYHRIQDDTWDTECKVIFKGSYFKYIKTREYKTNKKKEIIYESDPFYYVNLNFLDIYYGTYNCDHAVVFRLNNGTSYNLKFADEFRGDLNTLKKFANNLYRRCIVLGLIDKIQITDEFKKFLVLEIPPETVKSGGCYVATCIYGSYDCPEVWRLRRYRDYYLNEHWWGRVFIKVYYAISPTLVKRFGDKKWFRKPMKKLVDRKILKAKSMGFDDTKYNDKY